MQLKLFAMKILKIAGHPVLVMSVFLLLLISGESFGGFYVLYILLGLPHGVPDALLAVGGLAVMLLGYKIYRKQFSPIKPLLYLAGNALMIYSLFVFFRMSKGYNDATFHQTVPFISFVLYGLCVLCNLFYSIILFLNKNTPKNSHPLNIVS